MWFLLVIVLGALPALGQTGCAAPTTWTSCDLAFDLMPPDTNYGVDNIVTRLLAHDLGG